MKLHAFTIAIAVAGFAGAAAAGQPNTIMRPGNAIELLSQATGLTTHEVEMALGPSANYEYPVRYESAHRRFRQAVGRTLYEQIMGEGVLSAQQMQDLIAAAHARQAKLAGVK